MKKLFILSAVLILAACGAAVKLATPTETDVDKGKSIYPNLTLAELNKGKLAYETNCAGCHGLKDPVKYSESKLLQVVPPMAKKAKIDKDTEAIILKYMLTMSKEGQK
ncbi:MAG: hypothetical protein NT150_13830 [Bacteroidetes bacterium]|nr:hypothetical protein [Bacteroidota bacterium]